MLVPPSVQAEEPLNHWEMRIQCAIWDFVSEQIPLLYGFVFGIDALPCIFSQDPPKPLLAKLQSCRLCVILAIHKVLGIFPSCI
jgi:hypothetical protein